jgi:hypothetical protein
LSDCVAFTLAGHRRLSLGFSAGGDIEVSEEEIRAALVAHKREIESLNGELFALRALLFYLLDFSARNDMVRGVFDAAADHVENAAIRHGKSASPEHLVKALGIVEDFRAKIFPNVKK